MEGFSARLPRRAGAEADCLDEMHRLVAAAGFRVGAVVGRAESDLTPEDRSYWKAFEGAQWFAPLPHDAALLLGCGSAGRERFGLVFGEASLIGTVVNDSITEDGLTRSAIDEKRWILSGPVEGAGAAYASLRKSVKGAIEEFFEKAAPDDPLLAPLDAAAQRFREVYEKLSACVGKSDELIATGTALLQSPSLSRRIAAGMGVPLTLSTEPEPAARGAALWALERTGAISHLEALPASTAAVIRPVAVTS